MPFDNRRGRRDGRARRRPVLAPPEQLEGRELLAFTPLGVALPDLTVSGFSGPTAAYGGPLTVAVDVRNLGASTLTEPLNLAPGAPNNADAPPSLVGVFLASSPDVRGRLIGTIPVPTVPQNSIVRVSGTVTLPARAGLDRRFPDEGGTVYLNFVADVTRVVQEIDEANNRAIHDAAVPVQLAPALPDLRSVALGLPPGLQPGAAIRPTIRVGNFGTVPSNQQGPVTVFLVASQDPFFGPGDAIVTAFTLDNIPALSQAPTRAQHPVLGDVNLDPPPNIVTLIGPVVNLPTEPGSYFVGLIVDPNNTIQEISELVTGPDPRLELPVFVTGPVVDQPDVPAFPIPSPPQFRFPIPPFGPIFAIAPTAGLVTGREPPSFVFDPGPIPIFPESPITDGTTFFAARGARGRARRARR